MENRFAVQNRLAAAEHDYWRQRALAQLRYLEEINDVSGGTHDVLLDEATAFLKRISDRSGTIAKESCLAFERMLHPVSADAKAVTVSCAGHAHIDMNWLWRFDETVMITIDTMRTMLQLMREYKTFTFVQSQASVYKILEEYAPELLPEIRRRIREGRWEVVASTWVEGDKNMPNAESLSRHMLYTRRYLKKLLPLDDSHFTVDFEPDTFGHNLNLAEIAASGGVKYYYHCRGYQDHHIYKTRAPSGAEIIVFRDPIWYNDIITAETFLYVPSFCAQNKLTQLIHLFGTGNHGGGATRRDIERLLDMSTWPCMPAITFGWLTDFFRTLDNLDLPVVDHELNFIFNGCYASQTRIKKANRVAQDALFEAEALNAFSHLNGAHPYAAQAFFKAWEPVLFSHFHDILPGTGITDTREYTLGAFQKTMACAGSRKSAAVRGLMGQVNTALLLPRNEKDTASTAEGAGLGYGIDGFRYMANSTAGGLRRIIHLVNPSALTSRRPVVVTLWDWPGDRIKVIFTDEQGRPVPCELMGQTESAYWGHAYFQCLVHCEVEPFGYRTLLVGEQPRVTPKHVEINPRKDEILPLVLDNGTVRAEFDTVSASLIGFADTQTGRDCIAGAKGGARFVCIDEDDCEGMTAWRVGRYQNVEPVSGRVRQLTRFGDALRVGFSYITEIRQSRLTVCVWLEPGSSTLFYDVKAEWRELGKPGDKVPQLGFRAPLSYECGQYLYDMPGGIIARPGLDYDVPANSFCAAPGRAGGLMLLSDSKHAFRCTDDTLGMTLIRSSYDPDTTPECYDHTFCLGLAYVDEPSPQALVQTAARFCHPAFSLSGDSHPGPLPLCGSFMRIETGDVAVSALKLSEDNENAMIVRLYGVTPAEQTVRLSFFNKPLSACVADAHECPRADCAQPVIEGACVAFALGALKMITLRIDFER